MADLRLGLWKIGRVLATAAINAQISLFYGLFAHASSALRLGDRRIARQER